MSLILKQNPDKKIANFFFIKIKKFFKNFYFPRYYGLFHNFMQK